jgi:hypothetical protein
VESETHSVPGEEPGDTILITRLQDVMLYEARFVRTQCGRPTRKLLLGKLLKRSGDGLLTTMRPERSGPRLFEQACKMGWKGWFRSIGSAPVEPADRCIGSRSKTPSRPAWLAPRTGHGDLRSEGHFGANAPNGRSRPPGLLPELQVRPSRKYQRG